MARISTYEVVPVPKLADKLIGTSVGGEIEDITYNFTLLELLNLFVPNIPSSSLQGVLDNGNTATQDIILYGTIYTTNLEVTNTATLLDSYLNGDTNILGALYDVNGSKGLAAQVLSSTGTAVEWVTLPPIFTPTLQQVLTQGNTTNIDIISDATIEGINVISDVSIVYDDIQLFGTLTDGFFSVGDQYQVLSTTGDKVKWIDLPSYSATSPLFLDSVTGVFSIEQSNSIRDGYLSSLDWITFNGKQNAGNYITALTGEATATGPGSVAITLSNPAVTGKVLTGLSITGGSISAVDSILSAFGKVQGQLNALVGGVMFKGVWNAFTNTPTLTSSIGTQGWYYIVDVAGTTNLNGITDWQVGDWAIFNGSTWNKIDNTDLVTSVNGQVGAVSLTTDDISEGSLNLYFTDTRARNSVSATTPLAYNNISGVFSIQVATSSQDGYLTSTDWTTFNSKQNALSGTGIVKSTSGTITYITDNSSNWNTAYNDSIVSAAVTGTSTKTLTLNQQDGGTITASWSDADTGLTSVGLSMPVAFSVANTPLTANGTLAVTAVGTATQYIRGDGQLATLPSSGGGGSSVFYYLNGSIAASVATYKQMANTAVIGAGTDFNLAGNGLIAQFLTDAGNPNRLEIPGGAWNFEMYFSMSSSGGTPQFYVELLKYDGVVFTSIASGAAVPETINGGTPTDLYLSSLAVPTTTLLLTDRLAVRVYIVNNSGGRTATLHTENSNLCQIITTFSAGISAINGLTSNNQYLAVGTSGTDFAINSLLETHTFNLPTASATNRGALSSADWTTFNNKQNALTNPITGTGGANFVPKFTSISIIANSQIYDNGVGVGIGITTLGAYFDVNGTGRFNGELTLGSTLSNGTYTYTLPSATGTLALTSELSIYVPYTGATTNVDLGTNFLFSDYGKFYRGILMSQSGGGYSATGYTGISASGTNGITFNTITQANILSFNSSALRTYTFPDASGTVSLTSDLSAYVPTSRTLTINGVGYDLSADRSWTVTSMVYPSAGIAVSTGTAWGTSIVDNSTDWNTAYTNRITSLTTTGTSGAATLISNVLNIPNYAPSPAARNEQTFTATAGQTVFSIAYTVGQLDVYYNGSKLAPAEFTATNGTSFTLATACFVGDIVDAVAYITGAGVGGSGTANELTYFVSSTTLGSLTTATYPSLTELSYVKGVTSAIQTQLNSKASSSSLSGYLPLTGGTLTGALGGTSASFSSGLSVTSGAISLTPTSFTVGSATATDANSLTLQAANSNYFLRFFNIGGTSIGGFYYNGTNLIIDPPIIQIGGKLLINTSTDAGYKLDVNGTGRFSSSVTANQIISTTTAAGYAAVLTNTNGASDANGLLVKAGSTSSEYVVRFANQTDAATFFTVKGNGNVGIGTTSPTSKLNVYTNTGNIFSKLESGDNSRVQYIATNSVNSGNFGIESTAGATYTGTLASAALLGSNGDFALQLITNSISRLTIANGGNVGIGTASPSAKFEVAASGAAAEIRINSNNTADNNPSLTFYSAYGSDRNWGFRSAVYALGDFCLFQSATSGASPFGGNTRLMITSGGSVLIGTTTSSSGVFKLEVGNGSSDTRIYCNSSDAFALAVARSSNSIFYLGADTSGNGIFSNGSGTAISNINRTTGTYTATSDINKKKDFELSKIGLNEILQLRSTLYRMKEDKEDSFKYLGFLAQEVKEFIPQAFVQKDDFIGLDYQAITSALVKSVQELSAKNEALIKRIEQLENK